MDKLSSTTMTSITIDDGNAQEEEIQISRRIGHKAILPSNKALIAFFFFFVQDTGGYIRTSVKAPSVIAPS